jgi:type IV secretory pathway VirB2 component (pilin)
MRSRTATADSMKLKMAQSLTFYTLLVVAIILLFPEIAHAQTPRTTAMGNVLCAVVEMVMGNMGRGLATLAVIIIGVGATLGKVSWGLAITVAVGIAVIFNAENIVTGLSAGSTVGC